MLLTDCATGVGIICVVFRPFGSPETVIRRRTCGTDSRASYTPLRSMSIVGLAIVPMIVAALADSVGDPSKAALYASVGERADSRSAWTSNRPR